MIELLVAAALAMSPPQESMQESQDSGTRLEDIQVTGRPLESLIRNFVDGVAAPNAGRNLARWDRSVCVGAANLRAETAQYLVDRISTVAEDLGLRPGHPGCTPNILVIASSDPGALTAGLIARSPLSFRPGGSGMDRGGARLRAFRDSDRPVRWWAVSIPTDSDTGGRASRLPGECREPCGGIYSYAPIVRVRNPSRISTQIVDNLDRVIVVVDSNRLEGVSAQQLADYIAMVSLAQIDPEAETDAYATILNLFDEEGAPETLTDWDLAYLRGLYGSQRTQALPGANRSEVVSTIRRAHRDARRDDAE
ncbi:hypothetical protein ACETK8_01955 [Brevundimonas staleyi]|uniref:DUF2927 domain-containing protein n=1 Tax=Brevundimonas staleyi TaxID=74326 RepID=A0ABW0FWT2_9CAUL